MYENSPAFVPKRARGSFRSLLARARMLLAKKVVWVLAVILGLLFWWSKGNLHDFDPATLRQTRIGQGLFNPRLPPGLQFFPASNPKIHVGLSNQFCGRETQL